MVVLFALIALSGVFGGGSREEPQTQEDPRIGQLQGQVRTLEMELQTRTTERDRARRTPVTREIVGYLEGGSGFGELSYYLSMPLVLIKQVFVETALPDGGMLTVKEEAISTPTRIDSGEAGRLHGLSLDGLRGEAGSQAGTFEVSFLPEGVILGFAYDRGRNQFDLAYILEGSRIIPLRSGGAMPHLMIRYQAEFLGSTEIQVFAQEEAETLFTPVTVWETPAVEPVSGAVFDSLSPEDPPYHAAEYGEAPAGGAANESVSAGGPANGFAPEGGSPVGTASGAAGESVSAGGPVGGFAPEGGSAGELAGDMDDEERIAALRRQLEEGPDGALSDAGSLSWDDYAAHDPSAPLFATGTGAWIVQAGAFAEDQNAENAFETLRNAGFAPDRDSYQGLTRVFIRGVEEGDLPSIAFIVELLGFGPPYIRK
ncbi:MAG: SPOR domain-containing protein [Spirochaetaceae bacterium]|jgi:hypothetical protein|nr:SPOR domain-containing protein [Spirochaetaceae bacterium]